MARFNGWGKSKRPAKIEGTGPGKSGRCIVGIDPDIDKSGVAVKNLFYKETGTAEIVATSLPFWDLIDRIKQLHATEGIKLCIVEGGHLNTKANFHAPARVKAAFAADLPAVAMEKEKRIGERIAGKVGSNNQIGRLLQQLLIREQIPYLVIEPTGRKITDPVLFEKMYGVKTGKAQQDIRDAVALVAGHK